MKTLFKTYTHHDQCQAKKAQYEALTGVKWDWYRTGDGMQFTPIVVVGQTPENEEDALALLPHLTQEYESFVRIDKRAKLGLTRVLSGALTLARTQRAVPSVNRNGNFASIRAKHSWEE